MKLIIFLCLVWCFNFAKPANNLSKQEILKFYQLLKSGFQHKQFRPSKPLESKVFGNPEVKAGNGTIIGVTYPESHAFYSIPYGQAPIGNLRFKPPVKAVPQKVFNGSTANYIQCYQLPDASEDDGSSPNYSEDCLVLNINVPSFLDLTTPPTKKLPVMFWIHGGAFFSGAGTSVMYDARFLSNITNTIVVSINYRLDAFGFLVYDDEEDSFDGNQGFKDQQLALEWVRDNIEYFGGDKEMVTIFGESAGAQSVGLHLMSEKSKPFYKRAIMESNPASFYYPKKREAKWKARALLSNLDCGSKSSVECLRTAPPKDIIAAHMRVAVSLPFNSFNFIEPYRPIIDEDIKGQPLDYFRSGNWNTDKEVIIGTNSEEVYFIYSWFDHVDLESFKFLSYLAVGLQYGPRVIERYLEEVDNDDPNFDYTGLLAEELSDMFFVCPSRHLARSMSATTTSAFNHPAVYDYLNSYPLGGYAFHGSELPFVFNNGQLYGFNFSESDKAVAKMFNTFWGEFAHTGSPSEDLSVWPYYTEKKLTSPVTDAWSNIRIKAPPSFVESEYRKEFCDFWDDLGFYADPEEN